MALVQKKPPHMIERLDMLSLCLLLFLASPRLKWTASVGKQLHQNKLELEATRGGHFRQYLADVSPTHLKSRVRVDIQ